VFVALAAALILTVSTVAFAETQQYQEIEIPWPTESQVQLLRSMPDLEPMKIEDGQAIRYLSTPDLTQELIEAGLSPTVIVDDLEAFYSDRMGDTRDYGDFYTYAELTTELDVLHATYPDLTTEKMSIGQSWEGNDIWAIKISDNPDVQEDEPEVLFDGVHHAREPISINVLLDFMYWLCENYGTDPEATLLVDHRQIWFVPILNPDGYLYNQNTNPNGGGMWRKNRRDNPGGCEGVDLNRNYSYQWGGGGSSGDMCDDTYRGPSPFSEPETSAIRQFINSHEFVTHDSYHSVIGVILYPWGYTTANCPDDATFEAISIERVRESGYGYGPAGQELYIADGVAFDWAYGEQNEKPKIFSFTTEVDGSGFWPQQSEIPGLVAENLYSNIYLALVAGAFVDLASVEVTGGNGNGRLDPGETADLLVSLKNPGLLSDATGVTLTVASDDAYIQLDDASSNYADIAAGATETNAGDLLTVTVDPSAPDGHTALFAFSITWSGGGAEGMAGLTIGDPPYIVFDDFESGNNGWSQDGSHTASTGDWVIIDPNPTAYQPGDDTTPPPGVMCWVTAQNSDLGVNDVDGGISAMKSPLFDLTGPDHVTLGFNWFHGQRDAGDDPSGDFFRIDLSNDGGTSYPVNLVQIGDVHHAAQWTALEIDVEDHLPVTNQMRLRFQASDGNSTGDIIEAGLDDLYIVDAGTGNDAPGAPTLISPPDGSVQGASPTLTVSNADDPEGDTLTYGFRVYSDELLTNVAASVDGWPEGASQTSWTVDTSLPDGTYYWRAYAEDAEERGPYMLAASFSVNEGVGVEDGVLAAEFTLHPASPNPFMYRTAISFTLPEQGKVRVEVFDVKGRRVRSLFRGLLPRGVQTLQWDGVDEWGREASAGEYFVQAMLNGQVLTRKVVILQ